MKRWHKWNTNMRAVTVSCSAQVLPFWQVLVLQLTSHVGIREGYVRHGWEWSERSWSWDVPWHYPPWTENHILYWFSLVLRLKRLSWECYTSLKWVVLTREVYWLPFVPECISHCEIGHLLGAVQTFCSGHTPSVGISRHLQGYKSYCSWLY